MGSDSSSDEGKKPEGGWVSKTVKPVASGCCFWPLGAANLPGFRPISIDFHRFSMVFHGFSWFFGCRFRMFPPIKWFLMFMKWLFLSRMEYKVLKLARKLFKELLLS